MTHPLAPRRAPASNPITVERLERALRTIARIVASPGGEVFVPVFERIESELEKRKRVEDARERARALLRRSDDSN